MRYYISIQLLEGRIQAAALCADTLHPMRERVFEEVFGQQCSYSHIQVKVKKLISQVRHQHEQEELAGISLSLHAIVEDKDLTIRRAFELPCLDAHNLVRDLGADYSCPIAIVPIALAFALHETASFPKRLSPFLAVYLGQVVDGALLLKGRPLRGHISYSCNVGHINLQAHGPVCGCGKSGCLEAFTGSLAIVRRYSALTNTPPLPVADIMAKAEAGEQAARQVFADTGRYLAQGVGSLINVLSPGRIALAGPLTRAYPFFKPAMTEELQLYAFAAFLQGLSIYAAPAWNKGLVSGCCRVFGNKDLEQFILF